MKIKILGVLICFILILVLFFQFMKERNKEQVPEYVFTYAENQPENYPTTLGGTNLRSWLQRGQTVE